MDTEKRAFDFDENKAQSNLEKHKVDFEQAQKVFEDKNRIDIPLPQQNEDRRLTIGSVLDKLYSVVYVMRNTITRIISARRANDKEKKLYNEQNNTHLS